MTNRMTITVEMNFDLSDDTTTCCAEDAQAINPLLHHIFENMSHGADVGYSGLFIYTEVTHNGRYSEEFDERNLPEVLH